MGGGGEILREWERDRDREREIEKLRKHVWIGLECHVGGLRSLGLGKQIISETCGPTLSIPPVGPILDYGIFVHAHVQCVSGI